MDKAKKKEILRAVKYTLIAMSAGIIQVIFNYGLLLAFPDWKVGPALFYLIGLIMSVIWNLTINKKYNFKAAGDLGKAIWLTVLFYGVFAPASTLLTAYLTNGELFGLWTLPNFLNINEYLATFICMVLNLGLEYPWQRLVIFKNNIDTNNQAQKEQEKEQEEVK